ncbi:MAG TPA: glycine zipper 2TM domain-containing protein [Rhizobiales bacterium]|nr:hypothetical protein BMS3Bbin10_02940 [bacterium BMS3Bbin10]HDO52150.1 glycine zipper 2TM domain-containing protein [Hyphomicrobiales bacterium]
MRTTALLATIVIPVALAACGPGRSAQSGTVLGAVAGGIIGSQVGSGDGRIAGAAVGAFLGGVVGNEIGRRMDEADRRAAMEAEYRALETGRAGIATPWRNPNSGLYGTVVPGRPYKAAGAHCRTYTHTIYINGRPETMNGRACRKPDGTWSKVS